MARVTVDTIIGDLLRMDQGTIPVLLNAGMHCIGCPSAQAETIGEAAEVHGIDAEDLVEALNDYLATVG